MSTGGQASVLWREGMFLCPQHLQAFARELGARIAAGDAIGRPGDHGLLSLAIDEAALQRDVFRIEQVSAVLRDGTLLVVPHNGSVPQREFGERFTGAELGVWLGVPAAGPDVPQLGLGGEDRHRYRARVAEVADENARDAARELEFKELCGHLFFGDEDRSGYECLPIARLVRTGRPQAVSALGPWLPPVLRCGAAPALMRLLADVAARARAQARDLAAALPDFRRLSSVESAADLAAFVKLQAVNCGCAVLEQLCRTPDLHPYDAWLELVRVVGELAIFGPERVAPELPAYDHAAPDACMGAVLASVRELLGAQVAVPYDRVAFAPDGAQEGVFHAALPAEWFGRSPQFYLGVVIEEPAERAAELVAAGVKLLAPADLESVLQGVLPGVRLDPVRLPPTAFPKRAGLHFFRVDTEGESRQYWLHVAEAGRALVLSALGGLGVTDYAMFVELRN